MTTQGSGGTVRDDRLLAPTWWTAVCIVPVLVAAWVVLYLFPGRTEQLWAWTVRPRMTPLVMGGGYLAGAYFFVRVARDRRWHRVGVGFLAVTVFTTVLLAATLLHWDRFNHDHVSFWAWLFLYVVSPFLLPVLAVANWRAGAGDAAEPDDQVEIPSWARTVLAVVGAVSVLFAVVTFLAPAGAVERWPWMLTTLTARSLSAYIAFTGLFLLTPLLDRRWTSVRIGIEAVTVGLVMTGIGALRARHDFTGPDSSVVGFVVALLALLGLVAYLQLRLSRRPPEAAAAG